MSIGCRLELGRSVAWNRSIVMGRGILLVRGFVADLGSIALLLHDRRSRTTIGQQVESHSLNDIPV